METSVWQAEMDRVCALARLSSDVLDISFSSGETREVFVSFTQTQRQQGLSDLALEDLATAGMLFYYDSPSFTPFTMKDMRFDVDIAWYRRDGKLIKKETVSQGTPGPIYSPESYTYVVEMPAGTLPDGDLKVL